MNLTLTHRRYVDYSRAHYAGNLVDGAYILGLFGDIATDVCLHLDGDEGLFAAYSNVTFHQPVRAGDVIEVTATVTRVGNRSRDIDFGARVVTRSLGNETTRGQILPEPILAVSATGTVVLPAAADPS
jgi:3-aminobutyryl-CoA ammonia-lyase